MVARTTRRKTAADLEGLDEDLRAEIIDGEVVTNVAPSIEHGGIVLAIGEILAPFRGRGGRPPGGWWLSNDCEVEFEPHEVVRPDVVGWRKERVPERPRGLRTSVRPDWVCEILSTNRKRDLVEKFRVYQRCHVPHYWILDPDAGVLTVYRWTDAGYLVALQATGADPLRAEPFDAVELKVSDLLGEE